MTIMKSYGDQPGVTMKQSDPDPEGVKIVEPIIEENPPLSEEPVVKEEPKEKIVEAPKKVETTTTVAPAPKKTEPKEEKPRIGRPKGSKNKKR